MGDLGLQGIQSGMLTYYMCYISTFRCMRPYDQYCRWVQISRSMLWGCIIHDQSWTRWNKISPLDFLSPKSFMRFAHIFPTWSFKMEGSNTHFVDKWCFKLKGLNIKLALFVILSRCSCCLTICTHFACVYMKVQQEFSSTTHTHVSIVQVEFMHIDVAYSFLSYGSEKSDCKKWCYMLSIVLGFISSFTSQIVSRLDV